MVREARAISAKILVGKEVLLLSGVEALGHIHHVAPQEVLHHQHVVVAGQPLMGAEEAGPRGVWDYPRDLESMLNSKKLYPYTAVFLITNNQEGREHRTANTLIPT